MKSETFQGESTVVLRKDGRGQVLLRSKRMAKSKGKKAMITVVIV